DKQGLLEIFSLQDRLVRLFGDLGIELGKIQVGRAVNGRGKRQKEGDQKEYNLYGKNKAIHKKHGRKDAKEELEDTEQKIEQAGMSKDAYEKAMTELKRLEQMPPMSAESTVSRNYLDWLLAVPWKQKSEEVRDIVSAEDVLNADHHGLEKVKERILEYLAV